MATINRTTQSLALPTNNADLPSQQPVAEALPSSAVSALRDIKHSIFSSLYSQGATVSRPILQFLDHEIFTQSFALQMGIAVAAGIPAGFAGRAAGQGLLRFVGNNALGRVAAFMLRIPVTHFLNQSLSSRIQSILSKQSMKSNEPEPQDILSMSNLGAAEVLGHCAQGLAGRGVSGFVLGRLIGGATNCLASSLEIFAGKGINKIARQILHRNLFQAVETRQISEVLNLKEWIKNSVMDTAFCAGHGVLGVMSNVLRRGGASVPARTWMQSEDIFSIRQLNNPSAGGHRGTAPTVESPTPHDFLEFARQTPKILRQTGFHSVMFAMGAMGEGTNIEENVEKRIAELKERIEKTKAAPGLSECDMMDTVGRLQSHVGSLESQRDCLRAKRAVEKELLRRQSSSSSAPQMGERHPNRSELLWVPPGSFRMGDPLINEQGEAWGYDDEQPNRQVTMSEGYWLQETPVGNRDFQKFVGAMSHRSLGLYLNLPNGDACMLGFAEPRELREEDIAFQRSQINLALGRFSDLLEGVLRFAQNPQTLESRVPLRELKLEMNDLFEDEINAQYLIDALRYPEAFALAGSFPLLHSLRQYLQIENAVPRKWKPRAGFDHPDQPAVGEWSDNLEDERGINWYHAMAYARYNYGIFGTLPTEAQWEWAARGADNLDYATANGELNNNGVHYNAKAPAVVDRQDAPRGPFGHRDLTGNVWEWCRSLFGSYQEQETQDPLGARSGKNRVLRGGSWSNDDPRLLRAAARFVITPDYCGNGIGFRVLLLAQD